MYTGLHIPKLTTGGDRYTLLPSAHAFGNIPGLYLSPTDLKHTVDYVTTYLTTHSQAEEGAIITSYLDSYDEYLTDIDQMAEQQTIITGVVDWMIRIKHTVTVLIESPDSRVSGRRILGLAVHYRQKGEEEESGFGGHGEGRNE